MGMSPVAHPLHLLPLTPLRTNLWLSCFTMFAPARQFRSRNSVPREGKLEEMMILCAKDNMDFKHDDGFLSSGCMDGSKKQMRLNCCPLMTCLWH